MEAIIQHSFMLRRTKMKPDCKNCIMRDLFDHAFPVIRTKEYDTTCFDHACGCLEYFLYDDTPGFREKDEWISHEKCVLNDSYELPQYKGTYEDLLKAR